MTVTTRHDHVLGRVGATLEGTVITAIAGPGDRPLEAAATSCPGPAPPRAATRSAATGHLDRQERPPGRFLRPKPLPGMRLVHQKCALGPLGARTEAELRANGGPWSVIAPALESWTWPRSRADRLPWSDRLAATALRRRRSAASGRENPPPSLRLSFPPPALRNRPRSWRGETPWLWRSYVLEHRTSVRMGID